MINGNKNKDENEKQIIQIGHKQIMAQAWTQIC